MFNVRNWGVSRDSGASGLATNKMRRIKKRDCGVAPLQGSLETWKKQAVKKISVSLTSDEQAQYEKQLSKPLGQNGKRA